MREEVDGKGKAEHDDERPEDAIGDAPGVARAGVAANGAGDHHEPAVAPLDGATDHEGDDGDEVGGGGDDHLEGIDFDNALDTAEGQSGHGEQPGAGSEIADVVADGEERDQQRDESDVGVLLGVGGVGFDAAADTPGDGSADGEAGGAEQEEVRDETEKGALAAPEQGECTGKAANGGDQDQGHDETVVLAEILAVAGDGGELAGPKGDGAGSVGLDGEQSGFEQRREDDEASASGNGVDESTEEGGTG